MNRKQRRAIEAQNKKTDANEIVAEKLTLFNKLGDECLTCSKAFDKQNKEMVNEWYVIVRQEEGKVNLYCPDCWERAQNIVENFMSHIESEVEDDSESTDV
jgi:ribosomal protein L44E